MPEKGLSHYWENFHSKIVGGSLGELPSATGLSQEIID